MSEHVAPDGRHFKAYKGRCLCHPCWQARCECGYRLTAHDFDEDGAIACSLAVMARSDFGHLVCRRGKR